MFIQITKLLSNESHRKIVHQRRDLPNALFNKEQNYTLDFITHYGSESHNKLLKLLWNFIHRKE